MKEPEKKVDSSWKDQVAHERAGEPEEGQQQPADDAEPKPAKPATEPAAETDEAPQARSPLGQPEFTSLVTQLAMQTMYSLGLVDVPGGDVPQADLEQSQYLIDLLSILEQKTKGNLTNKQKALADTLHQLRMAFVAVKSK